MNNDKDPLVSVIIPVKNGDHWLNDTIPAILNQQFNGGLELILIDSGSTDSSLSIIAQYPVKLISIKSEEFNHGLTRNLGVNSATGKYVVMTVQDAKPSADDWIQELLNGFTDDFVAAVCGLQEVPHHLDKNPADWYRPISKPELRRIHFSNPETFNSLSHAEQLNCCRWDDVNAMYKKEILQKLPFRETDYAEDALWAKDALLSGFTLVYNPLAKVQHYHFQNEEYTFRRNFITLYHFYKNFGTLPASRHRTLVSMLRICKLLLREPAISFSQKCRWLLYNYRNHRAIVQSDLIFLRTLKIGGGSALDNMYWEICKTVPQAPKIYSIT
jgi:rhamnosyltransferase